MRRLTAIGIVALLAAGAGAAETVTTLDGRDLAGALTALDAAEATIRTDEGPRKIALARIRRIAFAAEDPADLMAQAGRHVLVAADGSRLAVRDVTILEGRLTAVTDLAGRIGVPLEGVARLLRPRPHEKPADLERQRDRMRLGSGQDDTLLVAGAGGQWASVSGILRGLDGRQVQFGYEGTDTAMQAESVVLIEMAHLAAAPPAESAGHLLATDGSRVAFARVEFAGKDLHATSPSLGRLRIDPARVHSIHFTGGERLTYLSDLGPRQVRQTPFFNEDFPYRADRSVLGEPLRLGGTVYEKGLGLHARCEIVFDLAGAFQQFTALAGIDDAVRSGAARLSISLDGRPALGNVRLDRSQPPHPIRLDVAGARNLTILVDFAEGTFGSGARVNLCDAALSK